jgi:hypothetical protein
MDDPIVLASLSSSSARSSSSSRTASHWPPFDRVATTGSSPPRSAQETKQRLDDVRLERKGHALGRCRLVREVVERVEHVDPRLVAIAPLRDRRGDLSDLRGDPRGGKAVTVAADP